MIVSQLTARRDYAIAKIFESHSMLDALITDAYYNPKDIPLFKVLDEILPKNIVKTYKRYQPNVPSNKIIFDWKIALKFRYQIRKNTENSKYLAQIGAYKSLSKKAIKYCLNNKNIDSYYGFDTASLEFFEWAKNRDFKLYIDQCVAPRKTQIQLSHKLSSLYGLDERKNIEINNKLEEREQKEWELCSKILVPSNYVKNELIKAGAPNNKIKLVPFGYDAPHSFIERTQNFELKHEKTNGKLMIFFAGNAGLRKGIMEFIKVATSLSHHNVIFEIAGQVDAEITKYIKTESIKNVHLLGKLALPDLLKKYKTADIFLFPSYLEGSARVIFEAMSWGLPIVTTHETGSVIINGKEGFLSNAGEVDNVTEQIELLLENKELRKRMGKLALTTSELYKNENYGKNLINAL